MITIFFLSGFFLGLIRTFARCMQHDFVLPMFLTSFWNRWNRDLLAYLSHDRKQYPPQADAILCISRYHTGCMACRNLNQVIRLWSIREIFNCAHSACRCVIDEHWTRTNAYRFMRHLFVFQPCRETQVRPNSPDLTLTRPDNALVEKKKWDRYLIVLH